MLSIRKLSFNAKKNEKETWRFHTWQKLHADPDEMEKKINRFYKELFTEYDCSQCRTGNLTEIPGPVFFIVNTTSGAGRSMDVWRRISACLRKNKIPYKAYETKGKGHAGLLAEKISALPQDKIYLIIVGGDGTINEVLNGITDFEKVRFGVIPAGSGNDFSRGAGMKGKTLKRLDHILEQVKKDCYRELDLGEVSAPGMEKPRIFGISSGLGMDAEVCKRTITSPIKPFLNQLHIGQLTYLFLTVSTLFTMESVPYQIKYYPDDNNKEKTPTCIGSGEGMKQSFKSAAMTYTLARQDKGKMIFLAAMNFYAEGGGVPMAPDASAEDGKLSFSIAKNIPKRKTFFFLPLLAAGKQKLIRGFEISDFYGAEVRLEKAVAIHTDGEYCGDFREVRFRCLKKQLKLIW